MHRRVSGGRSTRGGLGNGLEFFGPAVHVDDPRKNNQAGAGREIRHREIVKGGGIPNPRCESDGQSPMRVGIGKEVVPDDQGSRVSTSLRR